MNTSPVSNTGGSFPDLPRPQRPLASVVAPAWLTARTVAFSQIADAFNPAPNASDFCVTPARSVAVFRCARILLGLALFAAVCICIPPASAAPGEFNAYGPKNGYALPFQLFIPDGTETGQTYPLVVVLHGEDQRGEDNIAQLTNPPVKIWAVAVTNHAVDPLFILVPQCPSNVSWFDLPVVENLTNVITRVMVEHPIDPENVYLDGYSMGARGALRLISILPDWWDAAIVTAAALGTNEMANYINLASVPLWFFAAEDDSVIPFDAAYAAFTRIWRAKGNAGDPDPAGDTSDPELKFTAYPASLELGHDVAGFAATTHGYADFFVPVYSTRVNPVLTCAGTEPSRPPIILNVGGKMEEKYVVERSTNLVDWEPFRTNTLSGTHNWEFAPKISESQSCFYRTHHVHPAYDGSTIGPEWTMQSVSTNAEGRIVLWNTYAGVGRSVILHLPPAYDGTNAFPLILCLHQGNGSAHGMELNRSNFLDYAVSSNRAVVAFPEGILTFDGTGRMWNPWNDSNATDDVDYLSRLIEWLTSTVKVESSRVFVCGFSDGAGMTQRFAATRPDLVAGAAAFGHSSGYEYGIPGASGIRYSLPAPTQPSVPILLCRGGEDNRIPPRDTMMSEKGKLVDTPQEQVNYWLAANDGEGSAFTTPPLPAEIDAEGDVSFKRYADCGSGNEVWRFYDPNLGHRWPIRGRDNFDGDKLALEFLLSR